MKNKAVGLLVSAGFILLVLFVAFKVPSIKNAVLGTPAS